MQDHAYMCQMILSDDTIEQLNYNMISDIFRGEVPSRACMCHIYIYILIKKLKNRCFKSAPGML